MNHEERAAIEAEQYEEALRKLADEKYNARRFSIYQQDPVALRHAENDVLTYLADSGKLKELIVHSLTTTTLRLGVEIDQILRDVFYNEAIREAEAELEAKPSRRPLGDSTVAALKAVEEALRHIKK